MKLATLIATTVAAITIISSHASTIEAFDATSALSDHFKSTHTNKDGLYTFCGILTAKEIKKDFLKTHLKQKDDNTIILSNGSICSVHRVSDPVSGVADFKVEVRGPNGKMDAEISAMKGQGFVIYSGIGADKSTPKFYLIKINKV